MISHQTGPARWLLTLLIAAWLPLCCCQAGGLMRAGVELAAGGHGGSECCGCCCPHEDNGAGHSSSCQAHVCCGLLVKAPPRADRWGPEVDAVGMPAAMPAVIMVMEPAVSAMGPGAWKHGRETGCVASCQTLLRQRCALIL